MANKKADAAAELIKDFKKSFCTDTGRKVLNDLMIAGNMLNTSCQNFDPVQMAYNEGKRSLVLYILSKIDTDPDALRKLMEESYAEGPSD